MMFYLFIYATRVNKNKIINQLQKQMSTWLMSCHQTVQHRKHYHSPAAVTHSPPPTPAELTNTPPPPFWLKPEVICQVLKASTGRRRKKVHSLKGVWRTMWVGQVWQWWCITLYVVLPHAWTTSGPQRAVILWHIWGEGGLWSHKVGGS